MKSSGSNASILDELQAARAAIGGGHLLFSHPSFQAAKEQLREALDTSSLVLLVGPSGVGKGRLIRHLTDDFNAPIRHDPCSRRAAVVCASNPSTPRFSFREFYMDLLEALDEPLPEKKVDRVALLDRTLERTRAHRATELALRRAVFSAIEHRGVEAIFVDEAVAFVESGSGRTLRHQLDVLRDLTDQSGCGLVLVATPRILKHLQLSGELLRRMADVYFPRYHLPSPRDSVDYRAFLSVVKALVETLSPASRPKLGSRRLELLAAGSLGCVGVLVKWFERAIVRCVRRDTHAAFWTCLEETVLSDSTLSTMRAECEDGEIWHSKTSVRTFGLGPPLASSDRTQESVQCSPSADSGSARSRPGRRNPRRDEVAS